MKQYLFSLLCAGAALLAACGDDDSDAAATLRFEKAVASDVTGTAATLSCRAPGGAGILSEFTAWVAYGTAAEDEADYLTLRAEVRGEEISARLSGLKPDTPYRAFAFLTTAGGSRIAGPAVEFRTQPLGEDETVLEITSQTKMVVPKEAGGCNLTYEVVNPSGTTRAEASSEAAWVHDFVGSDVEAASGDETVDRVTGIIRFEVDANPGERRTAVIEVTYPGVAARQVVVEQEAASAGGEARIIELGTLLPWPEATYAFATIRFGDYRYSMENVGDFGNGIQFKSEKGWLANEDDMGVIRKIELIYSGRTSEKNIRLALGASPRPSDNFFEAENVDGTYTFDCSDGYRYFKLLNGQGASYLTSIKIHCGGEGGTNPPPADNEPRFATPSFEAVTKSGAKLVCAYTYTGSEPVAAAWFTYAAASGAEQRIDAASLQSPATATLTGLTPATAYTFSLCLEIGGKTFRSASATFVTRDEQGGQTGLTRYAGWPELPVEVDDEDYYYANHICPDFRARGHAARNFTVCYSARYHCPVWVAAPLHNCYTGGNGNRNYGPDPVIPRSIQPSSKSIESPYNKGHLLGNHERSATSGMNKQVSYYTNMAPQHGKTFNTGGGAWNELEDYIDGLWCSDTLYMVSGCHFETWTDSYGHTASPRTVDFGGKQAGVPTMFYYVLLRTRRGNTGKSVIDCEADELQCVGFVMSHAQSKGHKPARQDMRSVAELEAFTGFKFFTNVPNAPKYDYNPSDWGM